ncbi:MAG: PrsW family intramembrane metalloprotease [Caldilineaceae bacterium]
MVALAISLAAAIIPTAIYVLIFYWADRYEREPLWLTTVAFVWGAVPAIVVSLIGEFLLSGSWRDATDSVTSVLVDGAIVAPIVEELAKGAALLLIFWIMRQEFDGVLDGVVYGALIGFGFAMTENFFYFVGAYSDGGYGQLSAVIFLRAVLFGLNHAFYTGLTGIGFGLARSARSRTSAQFWVFFGLAAAIVTHSLHNLGASLADFNVAALGLSLLVAVAGLLLILVAVLLSWRHERSCLRLELAEEIGVLLSATEYEEMTRRWRNPLHKRGRAARNQARRWHELVELALKKNRLRNGADSEASELVEAIARIRLTLAEMV